ncbi:MAG: carbohydrate-binding domain-containing protein [Atopobiaceae bacterium]
MTRIQAWGISLLRTAPSALPLGSDALDASGVVQVDGGSLSLSAGDDGLHADGDLAINGANIDVSHVKRGD